MIKNVQGEQRPKAKWLEMKLQGAKSPDAVLRFTRQSDMVFSIGRGNFVARTDLCLNGY